MPGKAFKSLNQVSTDLLDWPILKRQKIFERVLPVSYTHLDVYKRQLPATSLYPRHATDKIITIIII